MPWPPWSGRCAKPCSRATASTAVATSSRVAPGTAAAMPASQGQLGGAQQARVVVVVGTAADAHGQRRVAVPAVDDRAAVDAEQVAVAAAAGRSGRPWTTISFGDRHSAPLKGVGAHDRQVAEERRQRPRLPDDGLRQLVEVARADARHRGGLHRLQVGPRPGRPPAWRPARSACAPGRSAMPHTVLLSRDSHPEHGRLRRMSASPSPSRSARAACCSAPPCAGPEATAAGARGRCGGRRRGGDRAQDRAGAVPTPALFTVAAIAQVLDLALDDLVREVGDPQASPSPDRLARPSGAGPRPAAQPRPESSRPPAGCRTAHACSGRHDHRAQRRRRRPPPPPRAPRGDRRRRRARSRPRTPSAS